MASSKADKAYSLRMSMQTLKKSKNDKPSQEKSKPNFKFGGNFSTGRQIKTQPETRKKASVSAAGAGASKEKRTPGLRVRGMDSAGPIVRAGVGKKQASPKKSKSSMMKAVGSTRAKEKSKSMMRPAPKATGRRDINRRTY